MPLYSKTALVKAVNMDGKEITPTIFSNLELRTNLPNTVAMSSMTEDGSLFHLFKPTFSTIGERVCLLGNTNDRIGHPNIMSIDAKGIGKVPFIADADTLTGIESLFPSKPIPRTILKGSPWEKHSKVVYLIAVPNVIPFFKDMAIPYGSISDEFPVLSTKYQLAIALLSKVHKQFDHCEDSLLQVSAAVLQLANKEEFIGNFASNETLEEGLYFAPSMVNMSSSDHKEAISTITTSFPIVTTPAADDSSRQQQQQAAQQKQQPEQQQQHQHYQAPQQKQDDTSADARFIVKNLSTVLSNLLPDSSATNNLGKSMMTLANVSYDYNENTRQFSNIQIVPFSDSVQSIYESTKSTRAKMLSSLFTTFFETEPESAVHKSSIFYQKRSMKAFTPQFCSQWLEGNISRDPLTSMTDNSTKVTIHDFYPQLDQEVIKQMMKNHERVEAQNNLGVHESKIEALEVSLNTIGVMSSNEDAWSTVVNLINILICMSKQVGPKTRIQREMEDWLLTVSDPKLATHVKNMGEKMGQMPYIVIHYASQILSCFSGFMSHMGNLTLISQENPNLEKLDFSHLHTLHAILRGIKNDLDNCRITGQACNVVPACVPERLDPEKKKIESFLAKRSYQLPGPSSPDRRQGPPKKPSKMHDEPSQAGGNKGKTKFQRKQDTRSKARKKAGLIIPNDPSADPKSFLPQGLDESPCAHFITRGSECNFQANTGQECKFKHPIDVNRLGEGNLIKILDYLLEKRTAKVNPVWLKDYELDPKYASLLADVSTLPVQPDVPVQVAESFASAMESVVLNKINLKAVSKKKKIVSPQITEPAYHVQEVPPVTRSVQSTLVDSSDIERPPAANGASRVRDKIDKNKILAEYQQRFSSPSGALITPSSTQGKRVSSYLSSFPSFYELISNSRMKPSTKHYYRVNTLSLDDIVVTFIKHYLEFDKEIIAKLACLSKEYNLLVSEVKRLINLDFRPLLFPREDFQSQEEIPLDRVDMATALMFACDMHPGMAVRYLGGEYSGETRDPEGMIKKVKPYVKEDNKSDDIEHMRRILTQGAPSQFDFEEDPSNKKNFIVRGNQKSFKDNKMVADKTLNKEDKHTHLLTIHRYCVKYSPWCRHNQQGLNLKKKNPRVVWDASTTFSPNDVVLNEVSSIELEAHIDFGDTKRRLLAHIYNLRIDNPNVDILLGMIDVKACFRYPRIHADLTGAFGFIGIDFYHLATSMVFGSKYSATSWEPFRRTIQLVAFGLYEDESLVDKHKNLLEMISWDTDRLPNTTFVNATSCSINEGASKLTNEYSKSPIFMYVDDALFAAVGIPSMKRALASTIEAIFIVMGEPETKIRQSHLALDKWAELTISWKNIMLGLTINTRALTVGITNEYKHDLHQIIIQDWPISKTHFNVNEMQKLVGKIARLGEGAPWVYKLISHLYVSIARALSKNRDLLESLSNDFKQTMGDINSLRFRKTTKDTAKLINFLLKKASRAVHHSRRTYRIDSNMAEEIDFFRQALHPDSNINFSCPIGHIIPRDPLCNMFGDSSLYACGGFCVYLGFWWWLPFPLEIMERTLLHLKNDKDDNFISINCLEYTTVIINYCAAITAMKENSFDYSIDPHPVILSVTDNRSANRWTTHTAKKSVVGRALARLFCALLIDSPLGVNSKWIETNENNIADDISRIRKESANEDSPHLQSYNYSLLKQKYPALTHCRFFQPSPELLSMIWNICLDRNCPSLEVIAKLKQRGLGVLSS